MSTTGAQVVERVSGLLKLIASQAEGATTRELVVATGLTRPTIHRLLSSLAAEGLVDRASVGRGWVLGPEMFFMGLIAQQRYDVEDAARPSLQRLADETGESAFLSVRRGMETVCLLREEGAFPVRSFVLHVGARFPLGVGTASLAVLAFMPAAAVEAALDETRERRAAFGPQHDDEHVRELLVRTRVAGYSLNPGRILEDSWGMGAAVFDAKDQPAWALSITGIEPRFRDERRAALGRLLLEEAHRLTQRMQRPVS
jgi:DNA-binding IclR family transcriptional regulator